MSAGRLAYYKRILQAYLGGGRSQLSFWHETPAVNERAFAPGSRAFYMTFREKAHYAGPFDEAGIPRLDYRGVIGPQYNPIAIAQWGLGNWNLWKRTGSPGRRERARRAADWLVRRLEPNAHGVPVWKHEFDWEYRDLLEKGWYSALAQGQGLSLLCRMHRATDDPRYMDTARSAFRSLVTTVAEGGVSLPDGDDGTWLEETIVDPPTHILNGFLWALWGVHDYAQATGEPAARDLLERCVRTVKRHLEDFDCGFWSLYEQSGTKLPMLASGFYHALHISQLRVTARLLGLPELARVADRWDDYASRPSCAHRALAYKAVFKVLYY